MTKRAIGYIRVSTEEQVQDGVSLEAQVDKLRQYAELYDIELVDIKSDAGLSAKTLSRPGLQTALDALDAGEADALLIYKLDRLTRSVADLGRLIETHFQKHQLLSVTDHIDTSTANGRLILNVLGSVSQWERETVVERTVTALRYLKDQRRVYGHVPLGYNAVDGSLTPDDEEQMVIAEIQNLRSKGHSLRAIADNLNTRGIVGKRGGAFYASSIRAILGNSIHAAA